MNLLVILGVFSTMALIEIPGLVKKKYWRELVVFVIFLGGGFILSIMIIINKNFPNISTAILKVIKSLSKIKL